MPVRWPWRSRRTEQPAPRPEPHPDAPTSGEQPGAQTTEHAGETTIGAVPPVAVVYLHVPKCGGTSLHDWMESVLAPGMMSPERNRMDAELPAERVESFARHRVFSGHFDVIDADHFPRPQRRFTVFRDPVDRIVSLYDFWRAHDDEYIERYDLVGPRLAARMTFEEFVGDPDPRIVHDLDNTMVRTFTGLIRTSDPIADPDAALAQAVEVVRSFDHVGHVVRLDETVAWLREAFGMAPGAGGGLQRSNVRGEWTAEHLRNVERTVMTPRTLAAIEPLVRLDRALIDHACS